MTISRRDFLRTGASVVAAGAAGSVVHGVEGEGRIGGDRILVVIELNGGNDALNTVIPIDSVEYAAARPTLAISRERALRLARGIGLHPSMREMQRLYRAGQLAIIQGVGYPNPSRSHFRSAEVWHRGEVSADVKTGWVGRQCVGVGCGCAMVHAGAEMPELFRAPEVSSVGLCAGAEVESMDRRSWSSRVGDFLLTATQGGGGMLSGYSRSLGRSLESKGVSGSYPVNRFGRMLAAYARMIIGGAGPRFYHVGLGGFDTHARQAEAHAELLGDLSSGVGAFLGDLRAGGRDGDVLVMIFSEFGRRLRENSSAGTDHGTAGVMFFAGAPVRGGLYGRYPSLRDLDEDGDLRFTTDFRECYKTVVGGWLGLGSGGWAGSGGVEFV